MLLADADLDHSRASLTRRTALLQPEQSATPCPAEQQAAGPVRRPRRCVAGLAKPEFGWFHHEKPRSAATRPYTPGFQPAAVPAGQTDFGRSTRHRGETPLFRLCLTLAGRCMQSIIVDTSFLALNLMLAQM